MAARAGRLHGGRLGGALTLGPLVLGLSVTFWGPALGTAPEAPEPGALLFRRYCAVCHGPGGKGNGPNVPFLEEDQPRDLTSARYVGGLTDEHLYRAIAEGGQAIQGSRFMPPWGRTLSVAQIWDLVAYIRTLARPVPAASAPAAPAAGSALARELGCFACHRIAGLEGPLVGPDLGAEGSRVQRVWLVRFLKAPHAIRPAGYHPLSRSRMPDFRLSDEEAASLAEYLLSLRNPATERGPMPAAPASLVQEGRALFRLNACRACHHRDGAGGRAGPDLSAVAQRLKPGWVMRFIQDPQALDPLVPMPHLGVAEEAARAITAFLFGGAFPPPEAPVDLEAAARGAALFEALGCAGCHGGLPPGVAGGLAPDLSAAGDKLRPDWMAGFLRRPSTIRPWLAARMPDFRLSEAEVGALVGFIAELRDRAAPPLAEPRRFRGSLSEANVQAGRRLASRDFLSCASCHLGEEQPEGPPEEWAPDLRISARRLHADWVVRWLEDPQRLAPGTKMPSFFSDETSGPAEILDGDEERQMLALRDYILSLGGGHLEASGSPAAAAR